MTNDECRSPRVLTSSFVLRHSSFAAYKPRVAREGSLRLRGFVI